MAATRPMAASTVVASTVARTTEVASTVVGNTVAKETEVEKGTAASSLATKETEVENRVAAATRADGRTSANTVATHRVEAVVESMPKGHATSVETLVTMQASVQNGGCERTSKTPPAYWSNAVTHSGHVVNTAQTRRLEGMVGDGTA